MKVASCINVVCSICGRQYYPPDVELFFSDSSVYYPIFNDQLYYFCNDACVKRFELTPALATPLTYTKVYTTLRKYKIMVADSDNLRRLGFTRFC